jgi:Ca2+-transporting ATPase
MLATLASPITSTTAPGADADALTTPPWSRLPDDVVVVVSSDLRAGLPESEARKRLDREGPNRLETRGPRPILRILLDQFRGPVVAILAAAALVSMMLAHWLEAGAIGLVLAIDAAIGFTAEWRAIRSMEALRALGRTRVRVRRDGRDLLVDDESLVVGDIVIVEAGDIVAADARILEANKLEADESMLTGESEPVAKSIEPVPAPTAAADRTCMLHRGTTVVRGSGLAVVVAIGMNTEVGLVAGLAEAAEDTVTPLERRLQRLGSRLLWMVLAITAITVLIGVARGRGVVEMLEIGVALAVAAIPEGLPIVATVALARGLWRLARHQALVNRLAAVEVLGATGVIIADKTGTLTENRMRVVRLEFNDGAIDLGASNAAPDAELARIRVESLETMALCNNAALPREGDDRSDRAGDPLELAMLVAASDAGIDRPRLLEQFPETCEEPFDPATRRMITVHGRSAPFRVAAKGAAEAIVPACGAIRATTGDQPFDDVARHAWLDRADALAADGLRVLAIATGSVAMPDAPLDRDLVFLGLVGLRDPPRRDVAAALEHCRHAGLRVVMATGDHPGTARRIAHDLGILDAASPPDAVVEGRGFASTPERALLDAGVFARVDPAQKIEIIRLHQRAGSIVAMTGDGVNDAPALRQADIGVAMGRRGTAVAREAADMVLQDDAFSSIVRAIRHGRVIDQNIRRFVRYLLSCNLSEVAVVLGATAMNLPMPILPLQILYLNLVTDVFPALALGVGEGAVGIMRRPPRPADAPIVSRRGWFVIGWQGTAIAAATIIALITAAGWLMMTPAQAVTTSFLTLGLAQVWHVLDMRGLGSHPFRNDVIRNPWVLGSIVLCLMLLAAAVHVPLLSGPLGLDADEPAVAVRIWSLAIACSLLPVAMIQFSLGGAGRISDSAA